MVLGRLSTTISVVVAKMEHENGLKMWLLDRVSQQMGRNAKPSAAIIDNRTTKTTEQGSLHCFDGGKTIYGRKRLV